MITIETQEFRVSKNAFLYHVSEYSWIINTKGVRLRSRTWWSEALSSSWLFFLAVETRSSRSVRKNLVDPCSCIPSDRQVPRDAVVRYISQIRSFENDRETNRDKIRESSLRRNGCRAPPPTPPHANFVRLSRNGRLSQKIRQNRANENSKIKKENKNESKKKPNRKDIEIRCF